MRVFVTADANWESKVDHVLKVLELRQHFERLEFGSSLVGLSLVLTCRSPEHEFNQRIRLDQKTRTLSLDVMLKLSDFVNATHSTRRKLVADAMVSEVAKAIHKRHFEDFRSTDFLNAFEEAVQEHLLGTAASRYDHLCLEKPNLG
jgi:hypothetical protein